MCENHLTVKREGWLLGVLNTAGKSLGKRYPTNYLAAVVVVVHLHQQVMKREHQKMKKKEKKRQTILDKTGSIVGYLLLCFFKRRYLSNNC